MAGLGAGAILGLGEAGVGALQAGISAFGMQKAKKNMFQEFDKIQTYKADPEIQKILEMRKARLGMGLGSATKQQAMQGIESSAAQATTAAQQMKAGAGLGVLGKIQKTSQAGKLNLAAQDEAARERSMGAYERAAGLASAERAKQFASEKEKQEARYNIRAQQLAAKKQAVQQGINAIGAGLSAAAGAQAFEGGSKDDAGGLGMIDPSISYAGRFFKRKK